MNIFREPSALLKKEDLHYLLTFLVSSNRWRIVFEIHQMFIPLSVHLDDVLPAILYYSYNDLSDAPRSTYSQILLSLHLSESFFSSDFSHFRKGESLTVRNQGKVWILDTH